MNRDLLLDIARCPVVQYCLANPQIDHPCADIVRVQHSRTYADHQIPEPWSGHLSQAPILFLSSNPSLSDRDVFPTGAWGEHFTPRDVIRLMVNLMLAPDLDDLRTPHLVRKVYDPCRGTGGTLTLAKDVVTAMNPQAQVYPFGQAGARHLFAGLASSQTARCSVHADTTTCRRPIPELLSLTSTELELGAFCGGDSDRVPLFRRDLTRSVVQSLGRDVTRIARLAHERQKDTSRRTIRSQCSGRRCKRRG